MAKIMTTNEALDKYLRSLSRKERVAKSRDIRENLGISRFVLSDWRRGRTKLAPVYFVEIMKIVGVDLNVCVGN